MSTNTVYVTTDLQDASLWGSRVTLRDPHWINDAPTDATYSVRLRYRGPLIECRFDELGDVPVLKLNDAQRAIAAGQSAVIYDGDRVVGGGIISAAG